MKTRSSLEITLRFYIPIFSDTSAENSNKHKYNKNKASFISYFAVMGFIILNCSSFVSWVRITVVYSSVASLKKFTPDRDRKISSERAIFFDLPHRKINYVRSTAELWHGDPICIPKFNFHCAHIDVIISASITDKLKSRTVLGNAGMKPYSTSWFVPFPFTNNLGKVTNNATGNNYLLAVYLSLQNLCRLRRHESPGNHYEETNIRKSIPSCYSCLKEWQSFVISKL